MMDIDDPVGIVSDKLLTQNLHVSGQYDKVNLVFFQQGQLLAFLGLLIRLGDGKEVVISAKSFRYRLQIVVVANNERHFHLPLAGLAT